MRVRDRNRLEALLSANPVAGGLSEIFAGLSETGAVLEGHFELQSGLHSEHFLRFRDFGARSALAARAAKLLVQQGPHDEAVNIICPESAGYLLGKAYFDAIGGESRGAALIVAPVNLERRPLPIIRRGKFLKGRPSIIVNDVATTGRSVRPLVELARARGSQVVGLVHFAVRDADVIRQHVPPDTRLAWLFSPTWRPASRVHCARCADNESLVPAIELN